MRRGIVGALFIASILVGAGIASCQQGGTSPADASDEEAATQPVDAGVDAAPDVVEAGPARRDGGADAGCPLTDAGDAGGPWDGGLFQPFVHIPTDAFLQAVAIGDVTGDNRADVVATTSYYAEGGLINDSALLVFVQQGDGSLAAPVRYSTGWPSPQYVSGSVAIGDFNGDGRMDVAVPYVGGVGQFFQNAQGTLDPISVALFPQSPFTSPNLIRAGDFNADGRTDIAAADEDSSGGSVGVYLQDPSGALTAPARYPVAGSLVFGDLETGDLDGDGRTDVVVMNGEGFDANIQILYQEANGTMGTLAPYTAGNHQLTHAIAVGDLTGDCLDDVATNVSGNGLYVLLYPQRQGNLDSPNAYPLPQEASAMRVADLDGDGRNDLAVLQDGYPHISIYLQQNKGLAVPLNVPFPIIQHPSPHALAIGDVNGDGLPDIVAANHDLAGLDVLLHAP